VDVWERCAALVGDNVTIYRQLGGLVIDSETPLLCMWQEIYTQHGGTLTMNHWQAALGTHHGIDP
jgi:hypothetical protein